MKKNSSNKMKRVAAGLCVVMMISGAVPVGVIGGVAAINASAETRSVYTPPVISYLKGYNAVKLSWNEIEGAERYAIAGYINGEWKMLDRTEDTTYTLSGLTANTEYRVSVIPMLNGKYVKDFSNSIVVTPKPVYPKLSSIQYNKTYHQFRLSWNKIPNAQCYGVAVYLAGKWKIIDQNISANTTTYTSPKLRPGKTYKMMIGAKVNGKWDLSNVNSRAFTVTVR
ncbi:fibronectin type III domain-containing protein [Ruminococcus albus]|uniref:Fibronectin type-III domain-containing protein n=1 Tax=Ruminococcus albus TaxID=1264 RepID=A0A1I1FBG9_RUMAL|nr:fibronectin type III domain-containing protein [Ruminococcus albus]SFB96634.1 hypothetical protein SAMN02910406_00925 [Ruminococcus albus]